jgi:WD40 repeat protein
VVLCSSSYRPSSPIHQGRSWTHTGSSSTARSTTRRLHGLLSPALSPSSALSPYPYLPKTKLTKSGAQDATIKIYDVHSKSCLHILKGFESGTGSLSFSPAGFRGAYGAIAGGAWNATFRVWDVEVCPPVLPISDRELC